MPNRVRTPASPSHTLTSRRGIRAALLIGLAISFAPAVHAQNLAANGEFDTSVVSWETIFQATLGWTPVDHSGCSSSISGAAQGTNLASGPDQGRGFSTCIAGIVSGATYSFGADLIFPTGQTTTGNASVRVVWFESSDCSGFSRFPAEGDLTVPSTSTTGWTRVRNDQAVAPADSSSAALVVRLEKNEAGGALAVNFDGAYFASQGGFLFADSFERQSTCHWSSTIP